MLRSLARKATQRIQIDGRDGGLSKSFDRELAGCAML